MKKRFIKKAYIIYKKSVYQKYVLDEAIPRLKQLLRSNHFSTRYLFNTHKKHSHAIQTVETVLEELGIDYKISSRTDLESFKTYDLIITLGGDGTVLRAAQHVKNQMVLGVNTVPSVSVGALCAVKIKEFKDAMRQIALGHFKEIKAARMTVRVNGKKLDHQPINDILFTNISPAGTSRYIIQSNGKKEEHKSSGMWISTASGSTAAILAAGGKKQPLTDNRLQFLVREPYQGIYNPYKLTRGFVSPSKKITLTSKMIKSKLYFDGPTSSYAVEYGDRIEISLAKDNVHFVYPK